MNNLPKLSVVLPCYNEAENLPLIFERFNEIFREGMPLEVLLVNNGSTDHSKQVFEAQLAKYDDSRFIVTNVPVNEGYGFGILSGLEKATGEILAWTHADMQTDFLDVFKAYDLYISHNLPTILVKGSRKNRAIIPAFFTWGMGLIASWALKVHLNEIGAQPKLFSRLFYEKYIKNQAPYNFSLDLFVQYQAQKYGKIVAFPVYFGNRLHGEAKGGGSIKTRIKVTRRVLAYIFELKKHQVD